MTVEVIVDRLTKVSAASAVLCLEPDIGASPVDLVESLVARGDIVAFSAPTLDVESELWPSFWAPLFAAHGYWPYDLLRRDMWWDQRIDWRHRQNLVVFATAEAAQARGWEPALLEQLDLAQPALLMPELRERLDATVCIPWRPSPSRMAAFERVCAFWEQFGWPIVTADSDTEVFSLAQARNNAVLRSQSEVVVICDADTLIDPMNVLRSVAEPSGVCWPFTKYRTIEQKYLDVPYEQLVDVPYVNTWDGDGTQGVGGCLITTKREYWRLGGQPPEFIGWGWEDVAFTLVVRTLSMPKRAVGYLFSFEHDTGEEYMGARADSPGWDRDVERNRHLMAPYGAADKSAWKMRHLLKARRVEG